jgi:DMSO reductase anchor subunit
LTATGRSWLSQHEDQSGGELYPVPLALLAAGLGGGVFPALLAAAFLVQYAGLPAERWFFFAQANHPQSLYYQRIP